MSHPCNGGAQTEGCQDFWLFQCSKHPTHLLRSIHQCDAYKQPKAEDDLGYPAQKYTQQLCVLCLRTLCRKSCRKLVYHNSKVWEDLWMLYQWDLQPVLSFCVVKPEHQEVWPLRNLTQEMVPLALFSNDLSCVKKDQISKAIQNHNAVTLTNRHGTSFGKPNFPVVSKNQKNRSLSMFVGPD